MVDEPQVFLGPNTPLPQALRDALLPWLLPAAMVIASVELQRHWGGPATSLYLANLALIIGIWLGVTYGGETFSGLAGQLVDLVIFAQLVGGGSLSVLSKEPTGTELLQELSFWAPLVCVWWAIYYHGRPLRLLVLAALLYGGLLLTGQLSRPDHQPHEFIIQGAMALGLVTLFLNAVARHYHEHPNISPQSFDATTHDETTGAASRGYFEAEMDHTAALADRYRQPFSLIVAIIDDFAGVAPDRQQDLLRDFSWLVIDRLRHADTLCRWQDEKFIAILPNTSLNNARTVADSLRVTIANTRLAGLDGVTASIGICEHRLGEDPMSTLDVAEKAVLRAQRKGRNHLVVDGEPAAA